MNATPLSPQLTHQHTPHRTPRLSPQQQAALMDAAKARAHRLRREALDALLDAAWNAARSGLRRTLSALWPQSRTQPAGAQRVTSAPPAAVQNRPQGPLRLLEPRCSPSSLN